MLHLENLYLNKKLLEAPIESFLFPSFLLAWKNIVKVNDILRKDLEKLLTVKDYNYEKNISEFFTIINCERLLTSIFKDVYVNYFNNSNVYQKKDREFELLFNLESEYSDKICSFINEIKSNYVNDSTDNILLNDYLLRFKQSEEYLIKKNNQVVTNIMSTIKSNLEAEKNIKPIIFKNIEENNIRKKYIKMFNEYKKQLSIDYPCMLPSDYNCQQVLMNVSNRDIRKNVAKQSNNVSLKLESNINNLLNEMFNGANLKGFNSILEEKLNGSSLNIEQLKTILKNLIEKKADKLNIVKEDLKDFLYKDGLNPSDLKSWDYYYYLKKCENKWNKKKKNITFDKKNVMMFIEYILKNYFGFNVETKIIKRGGKLFTEYLLKDGKRKKNYVLNIVESTSSYFSSMVWDYHFNNNIARGLISIDSSDNLSYSQLKELIHELGHGISYFFCENKFCYENGNEAWEFIEVESLLLENLFQKTNLISYFEKDNVILNSKNIKRYNPSELINMFIEYELLLLNYVTLDLISQNKPFTYSQLKDKLIDNGILKLWASKSNVLFDARSKSYRWAEWVYPFNDEIANKIIDKYDLLTNDGLKNNLRNVYEKYFTKNIRKELIKDE